MYGYSGINITNEILSEYVNLLEEIDFSSFLVPDIYQIGMVKASELQLNNSISLFNNNKKALYGYLPDFDFGFSFNDVYTTDSGSNIQSDVRINIPNIGLSGTVSYSIYGESESWAYSISLSFPINKRYVYEYSQNEYSFSSESFLINLSGMLFSYNQLKDRMDTEGQYELLILKTRLLPAIKKYLELY